MILPSLLQEPHDLDHELGDALAGGELDGRWRGTVLGGSQVERGVEGEDTCVEDGKVRKEMSEAGVRVEFLGDQRREEERKETSAHSRSGSSRKASKKVEQLANETTVAIFL